MVSTLKVVALNDETVDSRTSVSQLGGEGGWGVTWVNFFFQYVPMTSQSQCPIIDYFVTSDGTHLSHFWEYVIFGIPG